MCNRHKYCLEKRIIQMMLLNASQSLKGKFRFLYRHIVKYENKDNSILVTNVSRNRCMTRVYVYTHVIHIYLCILYIQYTNNMLLCTIINYIDKIFAACLNIKYFPFTVIIYSNGKYNNGESNAGIFFLRMKIYA